jgi:hypothetical protein
VQNLGDCSCGQQGEFALCTNVNTKYLSEKEEKEANGRIKKKERENKKRHLRSVPFGERERVHDIF